MKSILSILVLAVATCIPYTCASAQNTQVSATVPFGFQAGRYTLPAGTYTLTPQQGTEFVEISDGRQKIHVTVLGLADPNNVSNMNSLVFHKIGNQYFLHEISRSDLATSVYFIKTKAEKMAARRNDEARIPTEDPILVALN